MWRVAGRPCNRLMMGFHTLPSSCRAVPGCAPLALGVRSLAAVRAPQVCSARASGAPALVAPFSTRHRSILSWARRPAGGAAAWSPPAAHRQHMRQVCAAASASSSSNLQPSDLEVVLDVLIEEEGMADVTPETAALAKQLVADGKGVVQQAVFELWRQQGGGKVPRPTEVSVVLCSDTHIAKLNAEWRGVKGPTDVLSFALQDEADGDDGDDGESYQFAFDGDDNDDDEEAAAAAGRDGGGSSSSSSSSSMSGVEGDNEGEDHEGPGSSGNRAMEGGEGKGEEDYPNLLLGDVVISVDTAARQAAERGYGLLDEARVLLVHGTLHLLGYDHETGDEDAAEMAAEERRVLRALGWRGEGLVGAAGGDPHSSDSSDGDEPPPAAATSYDSAASRASVLDMEIAGQVLAPSAPRANRAGFSRGVRLLALDMDGTLLNSRSKVLPSSVEAIRAALACGVRVMLATGKARPAAVAAMAAVGLAGEGLVVSTTGPGIFLQGLAVYGAGGEMLAGASLGHKAVRSAFQFSQEHDIPLVAFLGDECATLKLTPELVDLHETYYEPLARVAPDVDALLRGPPVRKLLFMADPEIVARKLRPYWQDAAPLLGAEAMQAVPNMLEVVPAGVNKWVGAQALLADLGVRREALMAIGDGENDLQLVANAGVGVAMGNAVQSVKDAATYVSASNDDDGVALAIERFVL